MIQQVRTVLEIDHGRGVVYVHDAETGETLLRICGLPAPIPLNVGLIDVTNKVGSSYAARATPRDESGPAETFGSTRLELSGVPDDLPPGEHVAVLTDVMLSTDADGRPQLVMKSKYAECSGANDGTCPKHPEVHLDSAEDL